MWRRISRHPSDTSRCLTECRRAGRPTLYATFLFPDSSWPFKHPLGQPTGLLRTPSGMTAPPLEPKASAAPNGPENLANTTNRQHKAPGVTKNDQTERNGIGKRSRKRGEHAEGTTSFLGQPGQEAKRVRKMAKTAPVSNPEIKMSPANSLAPTCPSRHTLRLREKNLSLPTNLKQRA